MISFYSFLAFGIVLTVIHNEEAVSFVTKEQNDSSNFSFQVWFFQFYKVS